MNILRKVCLAIIATFIIAAEANAGRWLSRDPIEEGAGFVQRDPVESIDRAIQGALRRHRPNPRFYAYRNEPNLYAFVGNDPANAIDPFGLCKIEIRHAKLGSLCGKAWYHAYIVVTDPNGNQTYFRSGPSAGGPSGGSTGATTSGGGGSSSQQCCGSSGSNSSGSSNGSSPGSSPGGNSGPWGTITTTSGPYVPGTIDWDPNPSPTVAVLNDNLPCTSWIQRLQAALDAINNANIPYNPFGDNSNATAYSIIEEIGFPRPQPPVWSPGAGNDIP